MADLEHLHPEFRRRVLATGQGVNSGARSHAKQQWLWDCRANFVRTGTCDCPSAGCYPANRAGSSWHEYDEAAAWPNPNAGASPLVGGPWALAVDFTEPSAGWKVAAAAFHRRCGDLGIIFPIVGEPWHGQPVEVPEGSRTAGAWRRMPAVGAPGPPPDPWADLFVPILATT